MHMNWLEISIGNRVSDLYHKRTGQRCNPDYGIVDRNNCHVVIVSLQRRMCLRQ